MITPIYQRRAPLSFFTDDSARKNSNERHYMLAVRDMPHHERPRERLFSYGPSSLSMAELLAVVLGTGTTKEEVRAMTSRIMREYGDKNILEQTDADKLSRTLDIPLGKALQIVAVGELGRRTFSKNESAAPTIRTPREVYEYVGSMSSLAKEHLRGLYLNAHYKVIHDETISIGTVETSIIHPREVFRPALEYAAVAVILVHNHPSGRLTPSDADVQVTEQLINAGKLIGIDLLDHIIVTKDSFASIPASYEA